MPATQTLLFVSPRFLFPVDSGGKIRTTQILRGLKGGRFEIHLVSPGSRALADAHARELGEVCDRFDYWPEPPQSGALGLLRRSFGLLSSLPMPVRADLSAAALRVVAAALGDSPTVAVFDFLHAAVLAPASLPCASVLFTHNVESEIFARHREVARNVFMRAIWSNQHAKMQRCENEGLRRFDVVVAVSERDGRKFESEFGVAGAHVIPTGVDLDFFRPGSFEGRRDIVFCGSMDWLANQDAMRFFMDEIWPRLAQRVPAARMTVVGRSPPAALVAAARARSLPWTFTGFVDDVRPIVTGAAVSVIPLRVGGGTRLKVYESMAMGASVVSTTIGVEGLPVVPGRHYLLADDPEQFVEATAALLEDPARCTAIAVQARQFVEQNFGHRVAARSFEQACVKAIEAHAAEPVSTRPRERAVGARG